MRFIETLLILFAAIFVAQLLISILILAALVLFIWTLYKRPREALVLGLAVLAVVFISTPIGLALGVAIAVGFIGWALLRRVKAARHRARCGKPAALPRF